MIGLAALGSAAPDPSISVLIEIGAPGGRAGLRDSREALRLARAAANTSGVTLTGVAGYEGVFLDMSTPDPRALVRSYLSRLGESFDAICAEGLFESNTPVLTAGGSACFDDVADILLPTASAAEGQVVIRSGCYLLHDHGLYEKHVSPAEQPTLAAVPRSARNHRAGAVTPRTGIGPA